MKKLEVRLLIALAVLCGAIFVKKMPAQEKPAQTAGQSKDGRQYSGMYAFLKDGEFVQVTVEDNGSVSGFVSRYGDDKTTFVDQFFKTGKLEGNRLNFTTQVLHGVSFDFKGTVERGEGKDPGDEAYYVLKGTLIESVTDANKKTTSNSHDVEWKMFPQNAEPK